MLSSMIKKTCGNSVNHNTVRNFYEHIRLKNFSTFKH